MKGLLVLLLAIGVIAPVAAVYADNLNADYIIASINAVNPSLTDSSLVGDSSNTLASVDINDPDGIQADYWVIANVAGGSPAGCDATVGSPVTVTLNLPAGVTASPSSFTINHCVSSESTLSTVQIVTFHILTVGAKTITASWTDSVGVYNTSPATLTLTGVTLTVLDTTAPVIAPHLDVEADAVDATGADVTYTNPTATDNVDESVTVTCLPVPGLFPLGDTPVTCNAVDAAGNVATPVTFTINVVDTTAPDFGASTLDNINLEADTLGGRIINYDIPTAFDNVDGPVIVTCLPVPGLFPVAATLVTCTATDEAGNTGSIAFNVTITDTTPPNIGPYSPIITQATSSTGATVTWTNIAYDIVDGDLSDSVICVPASGSLFAPGPTTVNCTVEDAHHNPASSSFTVTVLAYNKLTMGAGLELGKNTASGNIQFDGVVTTGSIVFKSSTIDFKSKSLTFVSVTNDGRTITATGSGVSGKANTPMTFTLTATDNGEPGRTDTFSIAFNGGTPFSGTLTKGNIQVHK